MTRVREIVENRRSPWSKVDYFWIAGSSRPIKSGVPAITTRSSMSVKPAILRSVFFILFLLSYQIGFAAIAPQV